MGNGVKSHSGAAKRLKRSGSGKIVYRAGGMRHCLSNKTRKQKRHRKGNKIFAKAMQRRMSRLIG